MKRINPNILIGPRSYFTSFDYRIVKRSKDLSFLKRQVERKLKLLLLIKSQITCAASHLTSTFAYEIFKENPFLLTEGIIIPAFRSDKKDLGELFEKKKIKNKNEIINFYKENIKITVNWELEDNSIWFRNQFLAELKNPKSLIRKQLKHIHAKEFDKVIQNIQIHKILSREIVEKAIKDLPFKDQLILLNFRELIYHMSGARVVNCESSLPQENYIDYDLADYKQRRTKLSDEQILWKLFFELALESFQKRMLPVELLDMLTFDDIMTIRQPILESGFQEKYDFLVEQIISGFQKNDKSFLYKLNELEKIRQKLEDTFRHVFEEEIPKFLKKKAIEHAKELGSVSSSIALGILGFIPGIGSVASVAGVLKDSPALLFNIGQFSNSAKAVSDLDLYLDNKEKTLVDKITNAEISDKSVLIDMVALFTSLISEKLTF